MSSHLSFPLPGRWEGQPSTVSTLLSNSAAAGTGGGAAEGAAVKPLRGPSTTLLRNSPDASDPPKQERPSIEGMGDRMNLLPLPVTFFPTHDCP